MTRVARQSMLSAAAAVLAAGVMGASEPARAQFSDTYAPQMVNVFYGSCVRHLQDDWAGLGDTMQQMGFNADPRPEVRKAMLGDMEGKVWSAQSEAGIVFVSFADEARLCAVEIYKSDIDPEALKKEFAAMSDRLLEAVSGNEDAQVERERDSGQVELEGGIGTMDYVAYLYVTDASPLAIYTELAASPNPDSELRGRMSISYVPREQAQQGQ